MNDLVNEIEKLIWDLNENISILIKDLSSENEIYNLNSKKWESKFKWYYSSNPKWYLGWYRDIWKRWKLLFNKWINKLDDNRIG